MHANRLKTIRAVILVGVALLATPVVRAAAVAFDTATVATVTGPQLATVDVPVFVRDASGSPLGLDQAAGMHIQAYSLKVNYSPASAVSAITFTRGGVTTALTPAFESSPSSAGTISLIDSFQESTNPIPFTLDGALPGNQVATLHVTLSPSATPGTVITLTLDPTLTTLSNDSATTTEMTANTTLALVNGSITVTPNVPALGHIAMLLLALTLAVVGLRFVRF